MSRRCSGLLPAMALLHALAAAQGDMPVPAPEDLPGLEIRQSQSYAGKGLYGYINGGADLYHEYGFERLAVQEAGLGGETCLTEVYHMSDPGGAFGIFSVSRGDCAPDDSLPRSSCVSRHAIQWAQGRYFVRVAGASGSPSAQAGRLRLARVLASKLERDSWVTPPFAAAAGATERTLLLIRGPLGMQNGFDRWSALVEGLGSFEAVIHPRENPDETAAVAEFRFSNEADLASFTRALSGRGNFVRSIRKGPGRLLILESEAPAESLWDKLKEVP